MTGQAFDLVTVGGGIGGAALARATAERGARVLVLERERRFSDRVRGEALMPWGVGRGSRARPPYASPRDLRPPPAVARHLRRRPADRASRHAGHHRPRGAV